MTSPREDPTPMPHSIPARRSPDGYVAQELTDGASNTRWVLTHARGGHLMVEFVTDEIVADWPILGEIRELDSTPSTPATLILGPDQVLIVALHGDRTAQEAQQIREQLRERLDVADVLLITGVQALAGAPAAGAGPSATPEAVELPEPDEMVDLKLDDDGGPEAPVWHLTGALLDDQLWVRGGEHLEIAGWCPEPELWDGLEHDLLALLAALRTARVAAGIGASTAPVEADR